jgi:hypothetical protein
MVEGDGGMGFVVWPLARRSGLQARVDCRKEAQQGIGGAKH